MNTNKLPELRLQITGEVAECNLNEFKAGAIEIIKSINTDLTTDQDFTDADKAIKWCKGVEKKLDDAKEKALNQTASIKQVFDTLDEIREETRQKRLELDRLVKAQKKSVKESMLTQAKTDLMEYVAALEATLNCCRLPPQSFDFEAAIKGKKTIKSIEAAIKAETNKLKEHIDAAFDDFKNNVSHFEEVASEHKTLFYDLPTLATKPCGEFKAIVSARIAEHKAAELKRQEEERRKAEEAAKEQAPEPALKGVIMSDEATQAKAKLDAIFLKVKSDPDQGKAITSAIDSFSHDVIKVAKDNLGHEQEESEEYTVINYAQAVREFAYANRPDIKDERLIGIIEGFLWQITDIEIEIKQKVKN
jgi:hypothetical protein